MIWGRLFFVWLRTIFAGRKKHTIVAHNPAFDPSFGLMQDYCKADVVATQMMHDALHPYNPVRK